MLATVLFSAAFTTGDTLTKSLRAQALENIGRVDVVVKAEQPESDERGRRSDPAPGARRRPRDAREILRREAGGQDPGPPRRRRRASQASLRSPRRPCP